MTEHSKLSCRTMLQLLHGMLAVQDMSTSAVFGPCCCRPSPVPRASPRSPRLSTCSRSACMLHTCSPWAPAAAAAAQGRQHNMWSVFPLSLLTHSL